MAYFLKVRPSYCIDNRGIPDTRTYNRMDKLDKDNRPADRWATVPRLGLADVVVATAFVPDKY